MTLYLRRRAAFSAGFRNPPPGESGWGHDYLVELTVGGKIDPSTGMVINIKEVDAVLKACVVKPLQGRLLDEEVPAFRDTPPTPENLVQFLWEQCRLGMPTHARLARITLWPILLLRAEVSQIPSSETTFTEELPMLTITRTYDFSASHRLHSESLTDADNAEIFGKCNWENGHGHNYEVEVTLTGDADPRTGQLGNGSLLDKIVDEEVLKPYDHKHLNLDTTDFRSLNPTSENLTKVIWDNLFRRLSAEDLDGARLFRVAVRETARNYFEYYGS